MCIVGAECAWGQPGGLRDIINLESTWASSYSTVSLSKIQGFLETQKG